MKRNLTRQIVFKDQPVVVRFDYYPGTVDTLTQPGDSAEVDIKGILSLSGDRLPVPVSESNGGNGDAEEIWNIVLDVMSEGDYPAETAMVCD